MYLLLLVVALFGIGFAALNSQSVTLFYYLGHKTMALSLLLVAVFITGCLMGMVVVLTMIVNVKLKNYHLRQRLRLAEKEIDNLRTIPLQDRH
jgi:uncharacterized membrane protein YciS (DUF1049 family)